MGEMRRLHKMLCDANIPHTFMAMGNDFGEDAMQIRIYEDDTFENELDDVVFQKYSH